MFSLHRCQFGSLYVPQTATPVNDSCFSMKISIKKVGENYIQILQTVFKYRTYFAFEYLITALCSFKWFA